MQFSGMKSMWEGLKKCLSSGLTQKVYAQSDNTGDEQKTSESDNGDLKPWKDLVSIFRVQK